MEEWRRSITCIVGDDDVILRTFSHSIHVFPTSVRSRADAMPTIGVCPKKHHTVSFISCRQNRRATWPPLLTSLGWHQRTARRVASHTVVIVLCTKLDAVCDRQATVVSRLLTTLGDDRHAIAKRFLVQRFGIKFLTLIFWDIWISYLFDKIIFSSFMEGDFVACTRRFV